MRHIPDSNAFLVPILTRLRANSCVVGPRNSVLDSDKRLSQPGEYDYYYNFIFLYISYPGTQFPGNEKITLSNKEVQKIKLE